MEYIQYALSLLLIISGIYIFISSNPVHSVLSLILNFCLAAIILLMFEAEFIGLLFIMVYVGAVAVLFLFIVMMINLKKLQQKKLSKATILIISFSPFVFFKLYSLICTFFTDKNYDKLDPIYSIEHFSNFIDPLSNIQVIGQALFNGFGSAVLLAGFVLLIALLGSICLTIDFKDSKKLDDTYDQLSRKNKIIHKF
jgi:NADH-quinone oxidoreductase subunit J